jgi:hypothetical protein
MRMSPNEASEPIRLTVASGAINRSAATSGAGARPTREIRAGSAINPFPKSHRITCSYGCGAGGGDRVVSSRITYRP